MRGVLVTTSFVLCIVSFFFYFGASAESGTAAAAEKNYMSCTPETPIRVAFDDLASLRFGLQPFKNGTVSVTGQLAPTADSADQTGFYLVRDMIGKEVLISPTDLSQRALATLAGQEFTCKVKRDPASEDAEAEEVDPKDDIQDVFDIPESEAP